MSKSTLVIDTPMDCSHCPCHCGEWGFCQINERQIAINEGWKERPEWCPLEPYQDQCEIAAKGLTEMVREWDRGE